MGIREDALALADELEGVSLKDDCESCLASGTSLCRGDLECAESAHKACAKRLREIVEHDAGEVTTMSAYDLLPDEDRKAIAWVREQGGLGAVEKRLMPEGMEWPKVDGEPVEFNTFYGPSLGVLEAVSIYNNGACEVMGHDGIIKSVSEIHAIVDAADGKPLEVGQTVYAKNYGYVKCTVLAIEWVVDGYLVEVENEGGHKFRQTPDEFTHQRPVLDADGVEIKQGDTVYVLGFDEPLTVKGFTDDGRVLMSFHDEKSLGYKPSRITHEQPDTWERIEEDATLSPWAYADRRGIEVPDYRNEPDIADVVEPVLADVVRRCRALAERGE